METEIIRLVTNEKVSDVHLLTFDKKMEFEAGQWIYVVADNNDKKEKRAYSIASSPSEPLQLCVKRIEGGFMSNILCDLEPGDPIKVSKMKFGVFTVQHPKKPNIFIATGTGITPFHSIIPTLLKAGCKSPLYLFYGARTVKDLVYHSFFQDLAEKYSNFAYISILSREDWKDTGHVQDVIPKYIPSGEGKDMYVCGLMKMKKDIMNLAKKLKFDKVHYELY